MNEEPIMSDIDDLEKAQEIYKYGANEHVHDRRAKAKPPVLASGCRLHARQLHSIRQRRAPITLPKLSLRDGSGIFRDHNCWKCKDGALPCAVNNPRQCEYPHAKND